ncbi:larval chymotrypsin-like protein precursor [Anopheles sinensis]|uniref:Larval chymotrypsin-like protein n=1 Tax=Anopheles sinensis TaxID=74873 RepID=A0A084WKU2_ANOSI|nr:larval chymotrypsin-like protein precursor [Anopheles sinensis]
MFKLTIVTLALVCGGMANENRQEALPEVLVEPYHVSLQDNGKYRCSGSIVDRRWILTSAFCVDRLSIVNTTVSVGTNNIIDFGGIPYAIDRAIQHSRYSQFHGVNNIALIRLAKPLAYDRFVSHIAYYDKYVPDNATLTIVVGEFSPTWNTTTVRNLPEVECLSRFRGSYIEAGHLCTVTEENIGACYGRKGGAVTWQGKLVAVFHSSYGHCGPFYLRNPDVHARVSYYHDWIRTTMANNSDEPSTDQV